MKLQSLAVIFAIIILPISLVMSAYVQTQIDTVVLQTSYDTKLSNATYDAIKAYQLNETNSNTQNITKEKIRDIEASVNVFYNTLGTSFGSSGLSADDIKPYIPALVYTLYDGYYIYSPFENIENNNQIEQGLKPYIYYSCRYTNGVDTDVVINYTLDNYITIYGTVPGEEGYVTRSGYLINPESYFDPGTEELKEMNETSYINGSQQQVSYRYVDSEQGRREKIYYSSEGWYKYTTDMKKQEVKNPPSDTKDDSARRYYAEARDFSNWVRNNLGGLTVGQNQSGIDINKDSKIFDVSDKNDPDKRDSVFNEHRREVIKKSIQTNLSAAIGSYNAISQSQGTTFNFKMPILTETDWDKILNNVSMISFMQGIPIKNKYYMGYEIVTNTRNKEFVDPDNIYFIQGDVYHKLGCENYSGGTANGYSNTIGYRNIDFDPRKVKNTDQLDNTKIHQYYPHDINGDYSCIISSTGMTKTKEEILIDNNIRKAYYTALARERYNAYKSNNFK